MAYVYVYSTCAHQIVQLKKATLPDSDEEQYSRIFLIRPTCMQRRAPHMRLKYIH